MNTKTRIELTDSVMSAIMKMAEGNPGALTVCINLYKDGGKIDPDDFMGGFGPILALDSYGIYGSRIWMFYKDVCKENLAEMIGVMRAVQLGFLELHKLNSEIDNPTNFDFSDLLNQVKEFLPSFNKENTVTS